MRRLDAKDLQVLRATRRHVDGFLDSVSRSIAQELYTHPQARPYYTERSRVEAQSRAWLQGVLDQTDLDALDAWLHTVADIHHRLGIPADFFVEICALVADHVDDAAVDLPLTEGVRRAVVRTFRRTLFRQAQVYVGSVAVTHATAYKR